MGIGDAAVIRTQRVRKQKTDRQDAQLILRLMEYRAASPLAMIAVKRSESATQA
jgi:hypothetical protein